MSMAEMKAGVLRLEGRKLVPDSIRGILRVRHVGGALRLEWQPRDDTSTTPKLAFTATVDTPLRLEAIPGQRAVTLRVGSEKNRAFFWIQESAADASNDVTRIAALNAALVVTAPQQAPQPAPAVDLGMLRAIMQQLSAAGQQGQEEAEDNDISLVDVLRPGDVCDILCAASESDRCLLASCMPEEAPHDISGLCETVHSPQFRQAVEIFELAIKSGEAGQLLAELGLNLAAQGPAGGVQRFLDVCTDRKIETTFCKSLTIGPKLAEGAEDTSLFVLRQLV